MPRNRTRTRLQGPEDKPKSKPNRAFEEYIQQTAREAREKLELPVWEESFDHTSCLGAIAYYPFENQCPKTGHGCRSACSEKKGDKCLSFEMHRVVFEVFGTYDPAYIFIGDGVGVYWHPVIGHLREAEIYVGFGTNNYQITKKIRGRLKLKQHFQGESLRSVWPASFECLKNMRSDLQMLKDYQDKITASLRTLSTCIKCNEVKSQIDFYANKPLCEECRDDVVEAWAQTQSSSSNRWGGIAERFVEEYGPRILPGDGI